MNRAHASEAISQIEAMFGKEFMGKAKAQLIHDLEAESTESMVDAIKILEREHSYLPSPVALIRMVRECGAAKADRRQEHRAQERYNPDPDGFKVFQAMNRLFFSRKVTRRQILQKIREAHQMNPNAGWATCGANLQNHYEQNGMDLDQPPAGNIGHSEGK